MSITARSLLLASLFFPAYSGSSEASSPPTEREYPEARIEEGLATPHRLRLEAMAAIFRELERHGLSMNGRVVVLYLRDNRFVMEAKPIEPNHKDGYIRASYDPTSGKVSDVYFGG